MALPLQVPRGQEFSPLKNNDSAPVDNPTSCRKDLYSMHRQFAAACGATVVGDDAFEIHPEVSYDGEQLEWMQGKTLVTPTLITGASTKSAGAL